MPISCSVSTPFGSTWSPVISLMKSSVRNVFHGSGSCARAAPAPPSAATQPAGCDRLRHASPPVVLKHASTQQGVHVCMRVSVHAGHDTDPDATACATCRNMPRQAIQTTEAADAAGRAPTCTGARAAWQTASRGRPEPGCSGSARAWSQTSAGTSPSACAARACRLSLNGPRLTQDAQCLPEAPARHKPAQLAAWNTSPSRYVRTRAPLHPKK